MLLGWLNVFLIVNCLKAWLQGRRSIIQSNWFRVTTVTINHVGSIPQERPAHKTGFRTWSPLRTNPMNAKWGLIGGRGCSVPFGDQVCDTYKTGDLAWWIKVTYLQIKAVQHLGVGMGEEWIPRKQQTVSVHLKAKPDFHYSGNGIANLQMSEIIPFNIPICRRNKIYPEGVSRK